MTAVMLDTATPMAIILQTTREQVHVEEGQLAATVDGRELHADTPHELRRMIAEALYGSLHTGQWLENGDVPFRLRDTTVEQVLADQVPHRKVTVPAVVCGESAHDSAGEPVELVECEGVRVWAPRSALSAQPSGELGSTVGVSISAARPALSPGFFLVDGTRSRDPGGGTLRVYLHIVDWQHAPSIWRLVLHHLEGDGIGYRTKILAMKTMYPRWDAMVVYLNSTALNTADDIAALVSGHPALGKRTSFFAERLGPGVSRAWEPEDTRAGMQGLSFGQHRASALAHALLDSHGSGEPLVESVRAKFSEANIRPDNPARNVAEPE